MDTLETSAMIGHEDRHWWYRGRRRIVEDELARLPLPPTGDADVLDAGCGSGRMLDTLRRFGDVAGVDMRSASVDFARERGHADIHQGVVEELPWPDAAFDLITCLDVLEHTVDDRVALRELLRVTRPGGHLLVTVPTYQALWSNHDILNHHYRRYNRNTFADSARATGWHVTRTTFFNSLLLPPAITVRLLQRALHEPADRHRSDVELSPPWMYSALEVPLRLEAAWLRTGRRLPIGLSLLAVLRAPSSEVRNAGTSPFHAPA